MSGPKRPRGDREEALARELSAAAASAGSQAEEGLEELAETADALSALPAQDPRARDRLRAGLERRAAELYPPGSGGRGRGGSTAGAGGAAGPWGPLPWLGLLLLAAILAGLVFVARDEGVDPERESPTPDAPAIGADAAALPGGGRSQGAPGMPEEEAADDEVGPSDLARGAPEDETRRPATTGGAPGATEPARDGGSPASAAPVAGREATTATVREGAAHDEAQGAPGAPLAPGDAEIPSPPPASGPTAPPAGTADEPAQGPASPRPSPPPSSASPDATATASSGGGIRILGRVVDEQGRGIGGAIVSAYRDGPDESGFFLQRSEPDGRFELRPQAGRYRLQARADGYGTRWHARPAAVLSREDALPLELEDGGSIELRIVLPRGP